MVEDILRADRESAELLERLFRLPPEDLGVERAARLLQAAIERKLMLEPCEDDNIRNLIIRSIKQSALAGQDLPPEAIQRQIEKYDCHQTSLIAKKKVLLFFYIEEKLNIHLDDEEAAQVQSVGQLASCVVKRMKNACAGEGGCRCEGFVPAGH